MGRKPIPEHLKVVKGTSRKGRQNPTAPVYKNDIPPAPDHLSRDALIEWGRVSNDLYALGLLTKMDRAALAAYCQAYGRWVDAEGQLAISGFTIETTNGNVIQHPLVGIANQAMEHMRKFLIEFGLTPASRNKVSAKSEKKDASPWGAFK